MPPATAIATSSVRTSGGFVPVRTSGWHDARTLASYVCAATFWMV